MKQSPEKNIPTVLIILGATGDLMSRKIAPTLYHMFDTNSLPNMFKVVGVARRSSSDDEYREFITEKIKKRVKTNKKSLDGFLKRVSYNQGLFQEAATYRNLKKTVEEIDKKWGVCSNKLFYLAVPPEFYETIFNNLSKSGLTDPCSPEEGWTRILVEKPFGENLETARRLEALLSKLFREIQIYRIDHYLAKEMIQNILSFRFSNTLFENIWNKDFIERIDIRLLEKLGVEDRGRFYDGLGALRDMGQNHILQMLAFTTMDHPESFESEPIRFRRGEILKTLKPPSIEEIKKYTYRAQYKGYRNIEGVNPKSDTETYFKLGGAFLTSQRWEGVPITLESGKRLGKQQKEIVVTFRHPTPCLCPAGSNHYENKIVFSLEPVEAISIQFWSKKLGYSFDIEERDFQFYLRKNRKKSQYIEEYEKLLLDCIAGDQTLFISTDEVRAMWEFTDPIVKAWESGAVKLDTYKPSTNEPIKNAEFIDKLLGSQIPLPDGQRVKNTVGMVGLGKMGGNIARQLTRKGWRVVGFDKDEKLLQELEHEGVETNSSIEELVEKLPKERVVWLMVPAGKPTDETLMKLSKLLDKNDVVIDGSNSFYKDSVARHKKMAAHGIHFIDVGVSGGPEGALNGASLMVGGEKELFKKLNPLFSDIAYKNGYQFFEGPGAGHFVKMVHNGIEYGMMQAIAEGFTILKKASYKLDLTKVADLYNHGAVIESRLVGWLKEAFELYGEDLDVISGTVGHKGTGEWTAKTANELGVKAKIIDESFKFRVLSKENPDYTGRILNALRERFGGHPVKRGDSIKK